MEGLGGVRGSSPTIIIGAGGGKKENQANHVVVEWYSSVHMGTPLSALLSYRRDRKRVGSLPKEKGKSQRNVVHEHCMTRFWVWPEKN